MSSTQNPPNFTWQEAGHLPTLENGNPSPGLAGPVTGVSHDVLFFGGGSNFPDAAPWKGGHKTYYSTLHLFKKVADSLIALPTEVELPYPVAYSANITTSRGVVVAGGENAQGAIAQVLLLNWRDDSLQIEVLPDLPQALTGASATVQDDVVYLVGGQNENQVSDQLYRLDLTAPDKGWVALPALPYAVSHTVLYAANYKDSPSLFVVGGRQGQPQSPSLLFDKVYRFDIASQQWHKATALPYALSAATGVTWKDEGLLVFSGDQGATFHKTEELIFAIAKAQDTTKVERLTAEKNTLQANHPGFESVVLWYDFATQNWQKIDTIPFPGQVTTTALLWDSEIVIPGGEIRAGVRTPQIIVGKLN